MATRQVIDHGPVHQASDGERWLPVPGWDGYEVSDIGRVRSWWVRWGRSGRRANRPTLLSPSMRGGYPRVPLCGKEGGRSRHREAFVHHLVLEAFIGPRPEGMICRHLDDDRGNARLDNLCWGTHAENVADMQRLGTKATRKAPPPIWFFDDFIPLEALIPWEVWKSIPGFAGYDASNLGRIRTYRHRRRWRHTAFAIDDPRVLSPGRDGAGYPKVSLSRDDGRSAPKRVHSLVISTFSPRDGRGIVCRHLDGLKDNPRLDNLRWGTHRENQLDRYLHGTHNRPAKLSDAKALEIKRRRRAGERIVALAMEFGVSKTLVLNISKGYARPHLGD